MPNSNSISNSTQKKRTYENQIYGINVWIWIISIIMSLRRFLQFRDV